MSKNKYPHIFGLVGLLLILNPALAHADAGVPMIFLTFPSMILALIPIVLIEAGIFTWLLRIKYRQTILPSLFGNLASTIIGIPLSWLLMVAVQLITGGGRAFGLSTLLGKIISVTWQAAWLIPYESDLWWMIPVAAAVGLIPAYFISVLIEFWIVKKYFKDKDRLEIKGAVVRANQVTYGLLFLVCLSIFAFQLATHFRWITLTPEDRIIVETTKSIKINSKDYAAYYKRGLAIAKLEGAQKAIPDFNKAIEINPSDAVLYEARGNVYLDHFWGREEINKAIADYDKALGIDANLSSAKINRDKAYAKLQKLDEASTDLNKAHVVIEGQYIGIERIGKEKPAYDAVDDTPNPYDFRKNMEDYQYVVKFKVTKQLKGTYDSATFAVLVHEPNETFDLIGEGQRTPYRIFLDASGKRMIQRQFALDNR
ncbi:MAG: hypothetical protein M0R66_08155 [Candidatus Omnitrophica bacterium]|nr:hypothetical protein [Candidatus Omnitrophota bacterium]